MVVKVNVVFAPVARKVKDWLSQFMPAASLPVEPGCVNTVGAPGGNAVLRLPLSYGGKFAAKGSAVSVFHTVMGTNTPSAISGTIGTGTASVSISARDNVEVTAPK